MNATRDIPFRKTPQRDLFVNVYRPVGTNGPLPAILWICGGGWIGMNRAGAEKLACWMLDRGYVIVSADYRLSDEAIHPAQIADVQAAIRWMRAHAEEFEIDPERIGIWGDSAGGHLAALAATAGDDRTFEPDGPYPEQSQALQAACPIYPPVDLTDWPEGIESIREVTGLLGGTPADRPDVATDASPVTYISSRTPPHLLIHGDQDKIVPIEQSERMLRALQEAGVEAELIRLPGVGHCSEAVYTEPDVRAAIIRFFDRHLKRA
ncbi:MAG: alpha/beta hydrolase fold domain-containing protein [Phycisphaerae bacterium]